MPIPLGIFATAGAGGAPAAAYELISTQLVSSSLSSLTFSSIPSTYNHLQIRFTCKTSSASLPIAVAMWFNGDNAGNYSSHWMFGNGTSVYTDTAAPTIQVNIYESSISSQDNRFGSAIVDVWDYKNTTTNKTVKTIQGAIGTGTAGNGSVSISSGSWRNTAAITSITFTSNGGGSRTIEPGSRFSLYGIKG
jgi:hypothetical protein